MNQQTGNGDATVGGAGSETEFAMGHPQPNCPSANATSQLFQCIRNETLDAIAAHAKENNATDRMLQVAHCFNISKDCFSEIAKRKGNACNCMSLIQLDDQIETAVNACLAHDVNATVKYQQFNAVAHARLLMIADMCDKSQSNFQNGYGGIRQGGCCCSDSQGSAKGNSGQQGNSWGNSNSGPMGMMDKSNSGSMGMMGNGSSGLMRMMGNGTSGPIGMMGNGTRPIGMMSNNTGGNAQPLTKGKQAGSDGSNQAPKGSAADGSPTPREPLGHGNGEGDANAETGVTPIDSGSQIPPPPRQVDGGKIPPPPRQVDGGKIPPPPRQVDGGNGATTTSS